MCSGSDSTSNGDLGRFGPHVQNMSVAPQSINIKIPLSSNILFIYFKIKVFFFKISRLCTQGLKNVSHKFSFEHLNKMHFPKKTFLSPTIFLVFFQNCI